MNRLANRALVAIVTGSLALVVGCADPPEVTPPPVEKKAEERPDQTGIPITRGAVSQITFERNGGLPTVILRHPDSLGQLISNRFSFTGTDAVPWGEAALNLSDTCAWVPLGGTRLVKTFSDVTSAGPLGDTTSMTLEAVRRETINGACRWTVHYTAADGVPATILFPESQPGLADARLLASFITALSLAPGHSHLVPDLTANPPTLTFTLDLPPAEPAPSPCERVLQPSGPSGPN